MYQSATVILIRAICFEYLAKISGKVGSESYLYKAKGFNLAELLKKGLEAYRIT